MNQELFKKHVCNQSSHYDNGAARSSIHCSSLSALFNSLHSNTNQLESTSVIKVATMKNTDDLLGIISIVQKKPSHATTKLMLFTVSKDEWNTKEDTGKSLKNTLDVLRYAKRHLSG